MTPHDIQNITHQPINENNLKNYLINYKNYYNKNLIKNSNNGARSVVVEQIQNLLNSSENQLSTIIKNLLYLSMNTIINLKDKIHELKQKVTCYETKVKNLEKQLEEALDETATTNYSTCSICLTNKSDIAFIKCGHMCLCEDCSTEIKIREEIYNPNANITCPICRQYGPTIKIYIS